MFAESTCIQATASDQAQSVIQGIACNAAVYTNWPATDVQSWQERSLTNSMCCASLLCFRCNSSDFEQPVLLTSCSDVLLSLLLT